VPCAINVREVGKAQASTARHATASSLARSFGPMSGALKKENGGRLVYNQISRLVLS
jgi:hypothetical protein